ncbi:MAG: NUDIX hydrolase [Caldilineaceae bacterium]|nr:NUDIX hydrolase [Caldilineaceae bacterium]
MTEPNKPPVEKQVSAGGVAYRETAAGVEIALIYVRFRGKERWQLPKGIVDAGESPEETALREIREEAGITAELMAPLDVIEYWYVGHSQGRRVRFHKFVHFFLCRYRSGDISNHDQREVLEARWVALEEAMNLLAFDNEKEIVRNAQRAL